MILGTKLLAPYLIHNLSLNLLVSAFFCKLIGAEKPYNSLNESEKNIQQSPKTRKIGRFNKNLMKLLRDRYIFYYKIQTKNCFLKNHNSTLPKQIQSYI